MPGSSALRLSDLRAMHTLVGDCRELGDDPTAWRYRLGEGVAGLTGAAVVFVVEHADDITTWTGQTEWGWETSGLDRAAVARVQAAALERTALIHPMIERYVAARAADDGVALTRSDLVSDREYFASGFYREYHRPTGAGPQLTCARAVGPGGGACNLTLLRPDRAADFGRRHRAIIGYANRLVAPLVGGPLARYADPSPAALPPRMRQVLKCLLEGDSDKQVGTRLGLTRHTVNQYTKGIYRHFGVGARAELLARWVRRGWGARCAWADGPLP